MRKLFKGGNYLRKYSTVYFLQEATTRYFIDSFRRNGRMDLVKEQMEKMNKVRKLAQEHIPKTVESISV
jgi:hypothetical protein